MGPRPLLPVGGGSCQEDGLELLTAAADLEQLDDALPEVRLQGSKRDIAGRCVIDAACRERTSQHTVRCADAAADRLGQVLAHLAEGDLAAGGRARGRLI